MNRRVVDFTYIVLALCLIPTLVGCASNNAANSGNGALSARMATITADFEAKRYERSYEAAVQVERQASGKMRQEASYLAGISALRTDRLTEAKRYLAPLERSTDPFLAGHTSASLGLIELQSDRPTQAIHHFRRAMTMLSGQDRAEAAYYCGLAYQQLGQLSRARTQFVIAHGAAETATFRAKVAQELDQTGFTIQLGAYRSLDNARQRAAQHDASVGKGVLGKARIIASEDARGQALYLVQVGRFNSHESARHARSQISGPAMIATLLPTTDSARAAVDTGP